MLFVVCNRVQERCWAKKENSCSKDPDELYVKPVRGSLAKARLPQLLVPCDPVAQEDIMHPLCYRPPYSAE